MREKRKMLRLFFAMAGFMMVLCACGNKKAAGDDTSTAAQSDRAQSNGKDSEKEEMHFPAEEPVDKIYVRVNKEYYRTIMEETSKSWEERYYESIGTANAEQEMLSYRYGIDPVFIAEARPDASVSVEEYAGELYDRYGYGENGILFFYDTEHKDWTLIKRGEVPLNREEDLFQDIIRFMTVEGGSKELHEKEVSLLDHGFILSENCLKGRWGLSYKEYTLSNLYRLKNGDTFTITLIPSGWKMKSAEYIEQPEEIYGANFYLLGATGHIAVQDHWGNLMYDFDLQETVLRMSAEEKQEIMDLLKLSGKEILEKTKDRSVDLDSGNRPELYLPPGSTIRYEGDGPLYLYADQAADPREQRIISNKWGSDCKPYCFILDRWEERLRAAGY